MSRLLMMFLAFAAIAGYGLSGSSSGTAQADSAASAVTATAASDAVTSSVLGVKVQSMPDTGCTTSIISPDKVVALIQSLPAAQQVALAKAMNASSSLWTAELYTGALGTGLCLPVQDKLILFPAGSNAANSITSLVISMTSLVQGLSGAMPH